MSDQEQRLTAQTGVAVVRQCQADGGRYTCGCQARLHANGAA